MNGSSLVSASLTGSTPTLRVASGMTNDTSLAKALIVNLDTGTLIPCMFNPKEYTIDKQNSWDQESIAGHNTHHLQFGSGQPAMLQMDLFFDTYADAKDVRKAYTDAIWELM